MPNNKGITVTADYCINRYPSDRCNKGVMELQFDESTAASFAANATYKFEQNTETFVTSRPTLMDPLDHRNVYIGRSGIEDSGEGMFARRDILPGNKEDFFG